MPLTAWLLQLRFYAVSVLAEQFWNAHWYISDESE